MFLRGFSVGVMALIAVIVVSAPAFADQAQTTALQTTHVAYNAPSQTTLPRVVPGNSASRIEADPDAAFNSSNSCANCDAPAVAAATAAPPAQSLPTAQPRIIAQVPSPVTPVSAQPHGMAKLENSLTLDGLAREGLGGSVVPGNTVSRIEGQSSIPLTCVNCSVTSGLKESRLFRYVAQGIDAVVVAADVRGGAHERIGFGSRPNPLAYMAALGAEDFIVDNAIGPNNTHVQVGVNFLLGGMSLFNAIKSH